MDCSQFLGFATNRTTSLDRNQWLEATDEVLLLPKSPFPLPFLSPTDSPDLAPRESVFRRPGKLTPAWTHLTPTRQDNEASEHQGPEFVSFPRRTFKIIKHTSEKVSSCQKAAELVAFPGMENNSYT